MKESYSSLKEIGSSDQTSQHPSHRLIMPSSDQLMSVFYEGVFPVRQGNILGRHGTIFYCNMHIDPAKDHLSLTHADVMVEGNLVTDNYVGVMAPLQQNNHNPTDGGKK